MDEHSDEHVSRETRGSSVEAFVRRIAATRCEKTAESYRRGAKKLLEFAGDLDLTEAPRDLMDAFVQWMVEDEGLQTRTIRLMVVGARHYLEFRRRQGEEIPEFPRPDIPRTEQRLPVVLSEEELAAFYGAVLKRPDPVATLLLVVSMTGLRSEEAATLKLASMKVLACPFGHEYCGFVSFDIVGKGRKRRPVPMLLQGNTWIRGYLSGYLPTRNNPEGWLFPGNKNRPIQTRTVREHTASIREELGVGELTPHTLRRTYATLLDRSGVSSFMVSQLLGHERPEGRAAMQTTARHYVHHSVPDLLRALHGVRVPIPEAST